MIAFVSRPIRLLLMNLIRFYQVAVSPLLRPGCRFFPTCSDYALEALQRKPLLRGLALIAWRLIRCQPLCHGGFDPVPSEADAERMAFASWRSPQADCQRTAFDE
ncbi:membrane protein insertion efficiency factor YidD [Candidatus Sumerlaeota bacterium]|nr:membrane protein insertion efficiency factor YidD [Candidatus Sumerlaeota bacterium]